MRIFGILSTLVLLIGSTSRANEFHRPTHFALLEKGKLRPGRDHSGGFNFDLKLYYKFATFTDLTSPQEVDDLITRFEPQLTKSKVLKSEIRNVLRDRYIFEAFSDFLKRGGRFKGTPSGGRYYDRPDENDPDPSPKIVVGFKFGNLTTPSNTKPPISSAEIRQTIVHELLHYVFDRLDTALSEVDSSRGTDHFVIEAIEDRIAIIDEIESGNLPSYPNVRGLYLLTQQKGTPLQNLLSEYVSLKIPKLELYNEGAMAHCLKPSFSDKYVFTAEQLRDLEFLWGYNLVLIQKAVKIAEMYNPAIPSSAFDSRKARQHFQAEVAALAHGLDTGEVQKLIP